MGKCSISKNILEGQCVGRKEEETGGQLRWAIEREAKHRQQRRVYVAIKFSIITGWTETKPGNKEDGMQHHSKDPDLRPFIFAYLFILHDGAIYKRPAAKSVQARYDIKHNSVTHSWTQSPFPGIRVLWVLWSPITKPNIITLQGHSVFQQVKWDAWVKGMDVQKKRWVATLQWDWGLEEER